LVEMARVELASYNIKINRLHVYSIGSQPTNREFFFSTRTYNCGRFLLNRNEPKTPPDKFSELNHVVFVKPHGLLFLGICPYRPDVVETIKLQQQLPQPQDREQPF